MYVSDEKNAASLQVHRRQGWALWWKQFAAFPWRNTVNTLRTRFGEDRLGLTASSLTFTTMLALVPFFTVALALLTAFPMFATVEAQLQRWLIESLIPSTIASQVLGYITQFASKASRLGLAGLSFLLVTALALILTMDRTLNNIWRVRQLRPLGQRVLIYWAAMSLGPLVLASSLVLTSSVVAASRSAFGELPYLIRLAFDSLEFVLLASGVTAMYRYVPNTHVRWRDALAGGLFVAVGIEVAKKVLTLYLVHVPTYSTIYGTFATLPILLIWIYVAWVIVLLGAVVAAYLPSLLAGVARLPLAQSWDFQLALECLRALNLMRYQPEKGLYLHQLATRLQVEDVQLHRALDVLCQLDWVGAVVDVDERRTGTGAPESQHDMRYVLLIEPAQTLAAPLVAALMLDRNEATEPLWWHSGLDQMVLIALLERRQWLPDAAPEPEEQAPALELATVPGDEGDQAVPAKA
ncbi:YihY family inner membrane protein [Comamonas sp.]|uniref:YihY family inner membrane protein n=1 Tax=Comamonas sp. TaxID=34028 RepID=UPI0028974B56|nr:YhjD/YihY/BrkB family envelope integrity protein [Comamonas sp.]